LLRQFDLRIVHKHAVANLQPMLCMPLHCRMFCSSCNFSFALRAVAAVVFAFAALTSLTMGEPDMIARGSVLPPNLRQLHAGSAAADSLLPLKGLQDLTLKATEQDDMTAAELRQLSTLTCLTSVDWTYEADAQHIDAAADGWSVLPLQQLCLLPTDGVRVQRNTLLQLSKLTRLSRLCFADCVPNSNIRPEMMADVLAQLTGLQTLQFCQQEQQQPADAAQAAAAAGDAAAGDAAEDAAAGSFLQRMLHRLAGSLHKMQLSHLNLTGQHIGRAEAAALAKLQGLAELRLSGCDLEDCCVAEIVLALYKTLDVLGISGNPRVTDGCLPVLAQLVPGIQGGQLQGTGVTAEGRKQYLPDMTYSISKFLSTFC
jgi:hypothetical protein